MMYMEEVKKNGKEEVKENVKEDVKEELKESTFFINGRTDIQ